MSALVAEALFGMAPFASKTFEELQDKILDQRQVEIPANSEVSEQCRDLLLKLLQREPQMRIFFDDFFSHPFIDLEHMPRADSLQLARLSLEWLPLHQRHSKNCKIKFLTKDK